MIKNITFKKSTLAYFIYSTFGTAINLCELIFNIISILDLKRKNIILIGKYLLQRSYIKNRTNKYSAIIEDFNR